MVAGEMAKVGSIPTLLQILIKNKIL